MKTISIDKTLELLENASAVILPTESGSPLLYTSCDSNDPTFLYCSFTDDEGYEYNLEFEKANNSTAQINDKGELVLMDSDGNEVEFRLLVPMKIKDMKI